MRVLIDLQSCQTESRKRGIGRYSMELAKAIARNARGHECMLLLSSLFPETVEPIREAFSGILLDDNISVFSAHGPVAEDLPLNKGRARIAELGREYAISELRPDIIITSSLFEGYVDDAVTSIGRLRVGAPTAVLLYDLIPFCDQDTYLQNPAIKEWYFRKIESLRRADVLFAISASTGREAEECLNIPAEKIVHISSAADERFRPSQLPSDESESIRSKYGLNRAFVMLAGVVEARKNFEGLIRAYALLPAVVRLAHQLLLVCQASESDSRRLRELARSCGLGKDELVITTSYLPDEEMIALYNLCKLFVIPSFHEGFGLPALEAMACGAAVIGSNATSIPEVIGREDALFNPRVPESMTALMKQALVDDTFARSLREHALIQARKFSWNASAERALNECERMHERTNGPGKEEHLQAGSARPRMAMVSPLPPEKTGIGDYSAELVPFLSKYYDLTLITDQATVSLLPNMEPVKVRTVEWFERNALKIDRVLYHFGNSPFHEKMFGLLREHPGVVVLHDFFLSAVLNSMEGKTLDKNAFLRVLHYSHGYEALLYDRSQGRAASVERYPCNREVLERAAGVIVHSEFAITAAKIWYGKNFSKDWRRIQQIRTVPVQADRDKARQAFGIQGEDFVVCSFGLIDPKKNNHKLLDAWEASGLSRDPQCRLFFVGENHGGDYGKQLRQKIQASAGAERISISGYVVLDEYQKYLAAADTAVQLRCQSRGETSRAVLDVLAHGIPLVLNANGALAEYPDEILIKLPDDFSNAELSSALERLRSEASLRRKLSSAGRNWVVDHHDPWKIAAQFHDAIEGFYNAGRWACYQALLRQAGNETLSPEDLAPVATALAENQRPRRVPQILVDVSNVSFDDLKTGIERVTRAITKELLLNPPEGWRVELVRNDVSQGTYRYARRFTLGQLGLAADGMDDDVVDSYPGDIFIGLDLALNSIPKMELWFEKQRNRGIKIAFVVYDVLPIHHPEWFPAYLNPTFEKWLDTVHMVSDILVCISRTVSTSVRALLKERYSSHAKALRVESFQLGADIRNSHLSTGLPEDARLLQAQMMMRSSFLMVGTIEPRKGHALVLGAFERLWSEGMDVNLVIVGKQGWMVDQFIEKLRRHQETANRLFWLDEASDEYLEKLYEASTALIAASEEEGFGLPLIEAARHKLPIIARDIAVFKEVAGNHAYYFSGVSSEELSDKVREWLELNRMGVAPQSADMPWITWEESTNELARIVFSNSAIML